MSLGGPSGGTKGSFKMDSGEDVSALWAFTNAIRTKLRDVRLAMEDRWERQRAKKAIRAAEYVVQEGDSLLAIAERQNMSVGDLARFNKLPGARRRKYFPIHPGDKLTIPTDEQLARMPAFEAPVVRDKRARDERANFATTVAAGLVIAACGVYAYQQLGGNEEAEDAVKEAIKNRARGRAAAPREPPRPGTTASTFSSRLRPVDPLFPGSRRDYNGQ